MLVPPNLDSNPMEFPQNSQQVAVPPEPHPKYPLDNLPDPPDDYIFLGRSLGVIIRSRGSSLAELRVFAKYWLWGFDFGEDKRHDILMGLAKVNYWMRPEFQFHTEADICNIERDGGPRLLQYTITPTPSPVSRHYPRYLTDDEMMQLGAERYVRPTDAPPHVPDTFMFQFLLPARASSGQFVSHLLPTGAFTGETIDQRPQMTSAVLGTQVPTQTQNPAVVNPAAVNPGVITQAKHTYQPDFNPNVVREAIEKTLIKLCYKDLERSHRAPSIDPVATRVATTYADLNVVQVGTHPTVSELRLDPHTHHFDAKGFPFPYRGRGPVWGDGSCAIDVSIVLGMLTMAGCTNIDRRHGKEEKFNEVEKAFIQVTNMNWDAFDDKVSIELRHAYWNLLCDNVPDIKRGHLVPVWAAWSEATRGFGQFQITFTETPAGPCYHCGYCEPHHVQQVGNCIIPARENSDKNGVLMSTLIARAWSTAPVHYQCSDCANPQGPLRKRHVSELPLRLVISIAADTRVINHTQDQTLEYWDMDGNAQTAHYRWLGGAYYKDKHVRVYWTDVERGEMDIGNIRKYDGQEAGGVILGGIAPFSPEERVPVEWLTEGIPLVIYERIVNPTPDMIHAASQTISDMSDCVSQRKPFLFQHFPWFPETMEHKSPFLPLERVLPDAGDRFYEKNLVLSSDAVPDITLELGHTIADQLAEWTMPPELPVDPALMAFPADMTLPADPMQDPDPNLIGIDPGLLQRMADGESLFDSYNPDPTDLMNYPEMWPEGGMPHNSGATTFPNLPKTPTRPGSGGRSPYWNWLNLSPDKQQFGANGKDADGERTVTVVKIRDDCRVGPSPYRLYQVPVKSIKAAMRRRSLMLIESQSAEKNKKKQSRVDKLKDELKDEEPRTAKRTKRNGVK